MTKPVNDRHRRKSPQARRSEWVRNLTGNARYRARQKGLEFTITSDWVRERLERGVCEVTGEPFIYGRGMARGPNSPSLDRIDPSKGYTPDNTRVVIWAYNAAKQDFTEQQFLYVCYVLAKLALHVDTSSQPTHNSVSAC